MKYVALLRGINVGGKNIIKMAELRNALEKDGLSQVATYIQSGNIVFESESTSENELSQLIAETIQKRFKLTIPVMVKSASYWHEMIEKNPYLQEGIPIEQLLASVAHSGEAFQQSTDVFAIGLPDEAQLGNEVIYLRCVGKYHLTKLTNAFFEKQFKRSFTTRNWKTVLKIASMLDS